MSMSVGDTDMATALKLLATVTARIDVSGTRFERMPTVGRISTPFASM